MYGSKWEGDEKYKWEEKLKIDVGKGYYTKFYISFMLMNNHLEKNAFSVINTIIL